MRDDREREYEVGYRRPPISGQFKKGRSGNPSGRPKKPSDFGGKFLKELSSPLTINENGKQKVITKDEGIAKQVINKALRGHVPSMRLVDKWRRQALESVAEDRQRALDDAQRTIDDMSDAELLLLIQQAGGPEMAQKAESLASLRDLK